MHTILLAEDQEDLRLLLVDVLRLEADWNVVAMPSGVALQRTTLSVVPDLVILDLAMPDLNGLETYKLLRQRLPTAQVPVLFVTANAHWLDGVTLEGRYELLSKPFDLEEFVGMVRKLLGAGSSALNGHQ